MVSRRDTLSLATVASLATLLAATPAKAFMGLGDGTVQEQYQKETVRPLKGCGGWGSSPSLPFPHGASMLVWPQADVLVTVRTVLDMPKESESKAEAVKNLRTEINSWVAKYRREPLVSGKQSYG